MRLSGGRSGAESIVSRAPMTPVLETMTVLDALQLPQPGTGMEYGAMKICFYVRSPVQFPNKVQGRNSAWIPHPDLTQTV